MEQQKTPSSENQPEINFNEIAEQPAADQGPDIRQTPEMIRLCSYSLLNAAMKFRRMFIDNEIQLLKDAPEPILADILKTVPKGAKVNNSKILANAKKVHRDNIDRQIKKIISFNKMAYAEIDATRRDANANTIENMESIANFIANCTTELLLARDQHEVVMLLEMYNNGALDVLFEEYRKEKAQPKDETTTTSPEPEAPQG